MEGRIFILIAEKSYPIRAAHACLEEFQRQVRHRNGVVVAVDRVVSWWWWWAAPLCVLLQLCLRV